MKSDDKVKTICVKCRHLVKFGPSNSWYDFGCGAIVHNLATDPVTGDICYSEGKKHPFCCNINKGNCEMFWGKD